MLKTGLYPSPKSTTSLINMYSKCNSIKDATFVFNYKNPLDQFNVYSYNAIINGYVTNGYGSKALELYKEMRLLAFVVPDNFTFPCLINGCCDVGDVLEVMKIHGLLFKLGLELDLYVGSALVNCYMKFEFVEDACNVFEELPDRDVVVWNSMVNGYAKIGCLDEALEVFRRMRELGFSVSEFTVTGVLSIFANKEDCMNGRGFHGFVIKIGYDSVVEALNALIDMYGKCKCADDALNIFETMEEKDIFSWNSIMFVQELCGDYNGTLKLFDQMLGYGILPDLITITTVLPACSQLAALKHGREIHGHMIITGLLKTDDMLVMNALIDMYAKCGNMGDAHTIFDKMAKKDLASWNIMITGYAMHGSGEKALNMFSQLHDANFQPDEITFLGVLSACNHSGNVRQGQELLEQMESKYGVVPKIEHYTCMIDMFGRAGRLEEAYDLAMNLPITSNPVVWRALLAACQQHRNSDLAKIAAERLLELEPENSGNYVLTSNAYVVAGQYKEVLDVRQAMRDLNVRKTPGCSWIELKDGVHAFINGDKAHPEAKSIYAELNSLVVSLREHNTRFRVT
ncbi:hypothetical protein ACFE04_029825 [Oxalis oulophora]